MQQVCIITGENARESLMKYAKTDKCSICHAFRGANKSYILSGIMMLWVKLSIPMIPIWYNHRVLNYKGTLIVIDDGITLQYLRWLKIHCNAERLIFYYWNTYRKGKIHPDVVRELGYEVWSYDEDDCIHYNMKYNPQMFFESWYEGINVDKINILYDVVFVGRDQFGRMQEMQKIIDVFEKKGIKYHMHFVAKKWYQRFSSRAYARYLNFHDMIREELKGKVVLDFCITVQKGFTLRIYDALYNHRKVITNNSKIKQMAFYSKENVFIFGEDNEELLADFICSDFRPISKEVLQQYSVQGWLERFL